MLSTPLSKYFGLKYPIISAPMATAAKGELARAVSQAGGLGLIGGGYGDIDWITQQFDAAKGTEVGCGLITWAVDKNPAVLEQTLALKPKALWLSFGDPEPYAKTIKNSNTKLICQVQTAKDALRAIECGADVVVAQGGEAGGHCQTRSTMTLVPEVADLIAKLSPETLLCAAGGIADGRGLAAALMLGADGVVMGSRLWASEEANVPNTMHQAALHASGDDTIRTSVMDIARKLDWPDRYSAHVLKNAFTERWANNIDELLANATKESVKWKAGWEAGDVETSNTFVGESTGLIDDIEPVADIIESIAFEAKHLLNQKWTVS
jgi:nitronate monooxygenase